MLTPFESERRLFLRKAVSGLAAGAGVRLVAVAAPWLPGAARAQTGADGSVPGTTTNLMAAGEPSATARGAAVSRALHQLIDRPRILLDPLAMPILGPLQQSELQAAADRHSLRASIVVRSRYAEDRLALAVAQGVRQYVVLGAGLDTFAYRNPYLGLRVFEVDHPTTQRGKRARLADAGIALPPQLTFVPIDFEKQTLPQVLAASGFRFDEPAFFSMLGVAVYLTEDATLQTLDVVAACATGSEIVFSFSVPDAMLTPAQRASRETSKARVATAGEPWIGFYDPAPLAAKLRTKGFSRAEVFTPRDANRVYFARRADGLRAGNEHLMLARV